MPFMRQLTIEGILLDYDEFYFAVTHCPYLFAKGTICVFDDDVSTNLSLYKYLERLDTHNYRIMLYCNENTIITSNGKPLRECIECYSISLEKM